MEIKALTYEELKFIEASLENYDAMYVPEVQSELFQLGVKDNEGNVIAGLFATCTAFRIVYVSMLYVDSNYRRQGIGKRLMIALEKQAKEKQLRFIRLDTFDYQGRDFYRAIGYEEVGCYYDDEQKFSEHFFLKRLK